MADTSYKRRSVFGITLLVVSVLVLLLFAFILTQRGGEVTGDVGADGVNPVPEQINPDEDAPIVEEPLEEELEEPVEDEAFDGAF